MSNTKQERNETQETRFAPKWVVEKDFMTDTKGSLVLRLERHIERKPTIYRWTVGALVPQPDKSMKFVWGARPWINRRDGQVTVKDHTALILMLVTSMQAYIKEKEQAAEDDFRRQRRDGGAAKDRAT